VRDGAGVKSGVLHPRPTASRPAAAQAAGPSSAVPQLHPGDVHQRIVESSEDCLKILDLHGQVIYVNSAGVRHLDLNSAADMLGRFYVDLWEPENREAARHALAQATEVGRGTFQGLSRTATGTAKWFDVVVTPITDASGAVVQLLTVGRDRTERRREETFRTGQHELLELVATGARLDAILDSLVTLVERQCDDMRCSVVVLDEAGTRIRHASAPSLPADYVRALDGMPIGPRAGSCGTAMYTGKTVIVTDIDVDPLWEGYRDLARMFDFRACWSAPIPSSQQKVLGSIAMYSSQPRTPTHDERRLLDLAANIAGIAIERHQAREALYQSEERNRAILRAIPDWMFVTSAEGIFLDYHAKDPSKLLVPPSMFLGRTMREILPPAIANALGDACARALESDEPETLEYDLGTDETQRYYEATVVRCAGDKVLSIVRDITDRKRAEMDASAHRQELAHLSRVALLGELSGALAHELSQPLTAILSNAQAARRFLDRKPLNRSELSAALDDIIRNDQRAASVIDRLRALLKKSDPLMQPLNLNEVTREVLELAHSDLLGRRIAVTTRLVPSLPLVMGDRIQLQQVVLNLVINACDAMAANDQHERRLTVRTTARGAFAEVSVSDRGIGVPTSQLDAVFEPFVSFREEGLGLGLAISRSIVVSHGGQIIAENNADRGATFRCLFPVSA
jgi:PAS domain S-box-containing protein